MELTDVWFALIVVLWIGYFFLEGFDFGVGILLPVIGKSETERRVMINTIGPVWDGNEVWLLVAGGATFAAFPEWYATLFSGFYLPLLLILVALIIRGVAFEYRGKKDSATWRSRWDLAIFIGSLVPAILWGVAFANIVRGVPINAEGTYTGGFFNLLNPYALLGGVVTLGLFVTHGATFLALKTNGSVRDKAHDLVGKVGLVTAVAAVLFLGWTLLDQGEVGTWITSVLAAASLLGALAMDRTKREGWAFILTGPDHRPGRAHPVHDPLPECHAEQHEPALQPHDRERVLDAVHPEGDDLGGRCHDANRAGLPVVDVLGVPPPDRRRRPSVLSPLAVESVSA